MLTTKRLALSIVTGQHLKLLSAFAYFKLFIVFLLKTYKYIILSYGISLVKKKVKKSLPKSDKRSEKKNLQIYSASPSKNNK